MTTPYGASTNNGSSSYSNYVNSPINGPLSTNQTPRQIPYHRYGILSGSKPSPPQFYPMQSPPNSEMNTNARQQYLRSAITPQMFQQQIALGKQNLLSGYNIYSSGRQVPLSSHINYIAPSPSSLYINTIKSKAIGKSGYKVGLQLDSLIGTKNYCPSNARSSLRRARSGGCTAPKKKGAVINNQNNQNNQNNNIDTTFTYTFKNINGITEDELYNHIPIINDFGSFENISQRVRLLDPTTYLTEVSISYQVKQQILNNYYYDDYGIKRLNTDGLSFKGINKYSNKWTDINLIDLTITQFNIFLSRGGNQFNYCSNLKFQAPDTPDILPETSLNECFLYALNFNSDNIMNWITDNVISFDRCFLGCYSFNVNIGGWNTSHAITMSGMFQKAVSFNQHLNKWNVTNVTDMSYMFSDASVFNKNNISSWDLTNKDTTNMF